MTEPVPRADYVAPLRHWSVDVAPVEEWHEMDLHPGDLRRGDLWLDPHGDQLRGVVESVEKMETHYAWAIQFCGFPRPWTWPDRTPIRVVRTARFDGGES